MNSSTRIRAAVATAALASTVLTPSIAQAKGGGDNVVDGTCTGAASTKLKVAPAATDGNLAIEFEVDVNRVGQKWQVKIFHNGQRVVNKTMTTRGLSGSFSVRAIRPDRKGNDNVRARATRLSDGQNCVARMTA